MQGSGKLYKGVQYENFSRTPIEGKYVYLFNRSKVRSEQKKIKRMAIRARELRGEKDEVLTLLAQKVGAPGGN